MGQGRQGGAAALFCPACVSGRKNVNIYLDLFFTFAKMGVCTFGGGYAMLPILQREVVDKRGWATEEELADYYAIGQCTPGIIAVNTATFVGQKQAGTVGGIVATLGIVFPSLVIITALASIIEKISHLAVVQNAFAGINVCVGILILNSVVKLFKKAVVGKGTLVIFLVVTIGALTANTLPNVNLSPVVFVLISALAGILLKNWGAKKA